MSPYVGSPAVSSISGRVPEVDGDLAADRSSWEGRPGGRSLDEIDEDEGERSGAR
jgi:hypothetical protein